MTAEANNQMASATGNAAVAAQLPPAPKKSRVELKADAARARAELAATLDAMPAARHFADSVAPLSAPPATASANPPITVPASAPSKPAKPAVWQSRSGGTPIDLTAVPVAPSHKPANQFGERSNGSSNACAPVSR